MSKAPIHPVTIGHRINPPDFDVVFHVGTYPGQVEMLRICKDGFWVRGQKVELGENEARKVYEAFCEMVKVKR